MSPMRLRLTAILAFAVFVLAVGLALGLGIGASQRDAQVVSYPAACEPVTGAATEGNPYPFSFQRSSCDFDRRCFC